MQLMVRKNEVTNVFMHSATHFPLATTHNAKILEGWWTSSDYMYTAAAFRIEVNNP
jgi:hypothetical protein